MALRDQGSVKVRLEAVKWPVFPRCFLAKGLTSSSRTMFRCSSKWQMFDFDGALLRDWGTSVCLHPVHIEQTLPRSVGPGAVTIPSARLPHSGMPPLCASDVPILMRRAFPQRDADREPVGIPLWVHPWCLRAWLRWLSFAKNRTCAGAGAIGSTA